VKRSIIAVVAGIPFTMAVTTLVDEPRARRSAASA
jgi:hypothetical protein